MALQELRLSCIDDVLVLVDVVTQVVDENGNGSFCTIDGLVMTLIRCQGVVGIVDDTICRLVVIIECVTVVNCGAAIACSLSHALESIVSPPQTVSV